MADLSRPRAQNGGLRPVPVIGSDAPGRVTTPTMIMKARQEREERRAQNEARRREQEEAERKRRSDERRAAAAAAGATAAAGVTEGGARAPPGEERRTGLARRMGVDPAEESDRRRSQRRSEAPETTSSQAYGNIPAESQVPDNGSRKRPTGEGSLPQPISGSNSRGRNAATAEPQPRPTRGSGSGTQSATAQTRGTAGGGGNTRAPGDIPSTAYSRQSDANPTKNGTTSSFPHAFERWEQLSAHWEGLTSYWIRRLEGNSDEIANQPINQQLARQVTDLSHAGANLFHAVVQLQRLRASSERKFQRWFFETRTEQERTQEKIAQLESQLQDAHEGRSREVRNDARSEADRLQVEQALEVRRLADAQIKEMKRELQISRDEARRSWEEIGRMEQAERDRTLSLKRGQPTLVGGVQVVPMAQGGHSRQTSSSRELGGGLGERDPREEGFDAARSDTDTDPYVESSRRAGIPPVPQIPTSVAQASQNPDVAASTSRAGRTATTQAPMSAADRDTYERGYASPSQPFYQQSGSGTALHDHGLPHTTEAPDDTISEEEYAYDSQGEIRRDALGNAIIFRRGEYDEGREGYDRPRYGQPEVVPDPVAPAVGGTSNGHNLYPPSSDYVWEVSRHQHPTRLSDVLEEDERSRTSPSRTSERSRGLL